MVGIVSYVYFTPVSRDDRKAESEFTVLLYLSGLFARTRFYTCAHAPVLEPHSCIPHSHMGVQNVASPVYSASAYLRWTG